MIDVYRIKHVRTVLTRTSTNTNMTKLKQLCEIKIKMTRDMNPNLLEMKQAIRDETVFIPLSFSLRYKGVRFIVSRMMSMNYPFR